MSMADLIDDELRAEMKEAKKVLQQCLNGEEVPKEVIRKTQCTFNKVGTIYLRQAIKCFHMLKKWDM